MKKFLKNVNEYIRFEGFALTGSSRSCVISPS
jgi:hypothetical protein